jgi:hypothetical protein
MRSSLKTVTRSVTTLKTAIFGTVLIAASLFPMLSNPDIVHAICGTSCTYSDPWGTQEVDGSGWMGGAGVPIYSNGPSAPGGPSPDQYNSVNGITSGIKWQCVELVNRLYITKGWITATWSGYGYQMYGNAPASLYEQPQGSITYINPGDVIAMSGGWGNYGHVAVVSSVSGGSFTIASQNTNVVYDTSFGLSSGNITYSGWGTYTMQGVIHNPGRSTPAAISRSSTSMDLFYTDGSNLVNYGWNQTGGWGTTSWADAGGTVGQPTVVDRTSDTMDVFYRTSQNKLIHKGWWANTGWVYFDTLVGSGVAGSPTAIALDSNNIWVFYRDTSGNIDSVNWVNNSNGGTWYNTPQNRYSTAATTDPYSVTRSSSSMEVFFGKNNGNIVHLGWVNGYGWNTTDWGTNSPVKNKPTAVVRNGGGDMSSYYQMNNGNVGEEAWDWQYGWSGQYWTAQIVGSPSATAGVNNVIDDFYREAGGNIVDRYFNGINWQTLNIVGAGGATGDPFAITRGSTSQEVFYWNGSKLMDNNWNTTSQSWNGGAQIN